MHNIKNSYSKVVFGLAMVASAGAVATELGSSNFLSGTDQFGMLADPAPGVYYQVQAARFDADEYRDNKGNKLAMPMTKKVQALAPRLTWVTKAKILGGQLVFDGMLPVVRVEGTASAFVPPFGIVSQSDSNTGVGDLQFGTALVFAPSDEFFYALALQFTAPTGEYDDARLANPGRNYWSARPKFVTTYANPEGLNADLSIMYGFNGRNKESNQLRGQTYKTGRELNVEYALGWAVARDWVAGVSGYVYQQTTDDEVNGVRLDGVRGRARAFGPAIKYDNGYGLIVNVAYQRDYGVRNRLSGDTFSVRVVLPF
ncbi:SphA family protein [Noviherbaspirillum massiliense]|uniref:SphA family protein n=1 Tax=Noviherbaspirillum massiliense TaxID=1465823 RepID=UPI0002F191B1|nr:transporter [Noviherbaspirillum massiliense]